MDKRTQYVEVISAQMVEWDTQIDRLTYKAENAPPGMKPEYSRSISALQLKRAEAAEKLQGISAASDHEWDDVKAGSELVWDELRTILHDAIIRIK